MIALVEAESDAAINPELPEQMALALVFWAPTVEPMNWPPSSRDLCGRVVEAYWDTDNVVAVNIEFRKLLSGTDHPAKRLLLDRMVRAVWDGRHIRLVQR